ncbi:hypothetical protein FNW10_01150 [Flavobacterium gawalongense]|uniref:Uncharacterized protein n=1 Tax=Flavobacterium gawalongense TaxID=2594432 RepID=A0A553BZL3_9FLAO|nr:hypothetical protein FNW11_00540 [Flavobacterium gawalongense]TRX15789.1 hypothetical protein FNW10_01150 [Flavobacterium gawalongense]TRX31628.1 hypothetical protein FNW38_01150 [Flavobacterium gawalongense]
MCTDIDGKKISSLHNSIIPVLERGMPNIGETSSLVIINIILNVGEVVKAFDPVAIPELGPSSRIL